jgi:hypothetical protein
MHNTLVDRDHLYDADIRFKWRDLLDDMRQEVRLRLSPVSRFYLSQTCREEHRKCVVSRNVKVQTIP